MGRPAAGIRLGHLASDFPGDLESAGKSPHTIRGYRSDLSAFRRRYRLLPRLGLPQQRDPLRSDDQDQARPDQAPRPRPARPARCHRGHLRRHPESKDRDQLLFRFIYLTGVRVADVLAVHVEDLDLTPDDEHVTVTGKSGSRHTILPDDRPFAAELRRCLTTCGYRHGPLFRAADNGTGELLRYQSVHEPWRKYAATVGVTAAIYQLRHSHATELVNDGVSLQTIRKRPGHPNLQTTLRYAEQSDITADNERWRATLLP